MRIQRISPYPSFDDEFDFAHAMGSVYRPVSNWEKFTTLKLVPKDLKNMLFGKIDALRFEHDRYLYNPHYLHCVEICAAHELSNLLKVIEECVTASTTCPAAMLLVIGCLLESLNIPSLRIFQTEEISLLQDILVTFAKLCCARLFDQKADKPDTRDLMRDFVAGFLYELPKLREYVPERYVRKCDFRELTCANLNEYFSESVLLWEFNEKGEDQGEGEENNDDDDDNDKGVKDANFNRDTITVEPYDLTMFLLTRISTTSARTWYTKGIHDLMQVAIAPAHTLQIIRDHSLFKLDIGMPSGWSVSLMINVTRSIFHASFIQIAYLSLVHVRYIMDPDLCFSTPYLAEIARVILHELWIIHALEHTNRIVSEGLEYSCSRFEETVEHNLTTTCTEDLCVNLKEDISLLNDLFVLLNTLRKESTNATVDADNARNCDTDRDGTDNHEIVLTSIQLELGPRKKGDPLMRLSMATSDNESLLFGESAVRHREWNDQSHILDNLPQDAFLDERRTMLDITFMLRMISAQYESEYSSEVEDLVQDVTN